MGGGGEGPTAPGGRLHVVVSRDSDRCSNVCEKVEKKKQTEQKGGNTERGGRGARGSGGGARSLTEKNSHFQFEDWLLVFCQDPSW